ncbi:MAG: GNAT family N-acetyltransferase [Methanomicrobia archaeon]|nr:GNAT family N-acetyltransferase [Methanomicrobia archaeon]
MHQGIDNQSLLDRLRIRRMRRDEVKFAIDLAAGEGWNPGIHDGACFYATDPNGFFVAELDGEFVGCISAVSYGDSFGFVGLFIVKPEYRGMGIGAWLGKKGLAYLADHNIGLDGVVERQPNYQRYGFHTAYRNLRYEGVGGGGSMPDGVVTIAEVRFEDLLEYDAQMFPVPRPQFLSCWIDQPEGVALAVVEDDGLAGYGVIRKCRIGYKIGPLFANNTQIAETLFVALRSTVPGEPIFLDTPEVNPAAIDLAERHHMNVMSETVRMYSKEAPALPLNCVFGVTSFELG